MNREEKIKKISRYMRYHHFNTHSLKKSHSTFISVLSLFEEKGMFDANQWSADDVWFSIRRTMNKFMDDELDRILTIINQKN